MTQQFSNCLVNIFQVILKFVTTFTILKQTKIRKLRFTSRIISFV
jgi:hypothetical protein